MTTLNKPVIASYQGNEINIHSISDVIAIDMDDTIVQLNEEWIKLYNDRTGKSRVVADITHYNFSNCEGFDSSIYDDLRTKGLFINLKPMRDALDVIYRLSERYTIIFLTYAVHGTIAKEKFDWILNNVRLSKKNALGPTVTDHIITARNKTFVRADILIDDAAHHAKSHRLVYGSTCIGVKCPWNALHSKEFDYLAEEDEESAWSKLERFVVEREVKKQELIIVGKRFNSGKSSWDLLPKDAISRCFDHRDHDMLMDISKSSLMAEMMIWYTNPNFNSLSTENVFSLIKIASKAIILAGGREYSFYRGLDAIAMVMSFGCKKYEARNWEKGLYNESTFGSAMRHLCAIETIDEESGLPHIAHAAWNTLILLEMTLRAIENPCYYSKFLARHEWRNSSVYGLDSARSPLPR